MLIHVYVQPGGSKVDPDTATVRVGENVSWLFHIGARGGKVHSALVGIAYFRHGTPFSKDHFASKVEADTGGSTTVEVPGGSAETPGDYKYGIRVEQDGDPIDDIDPFLIVRP